MPEAVSVALDTAGLVWLFLTVLVAGTVYGFAGFGSALIFMPVAVAFMSPADAIAAFSISALASLFTVIPKALPLVDRKAVTILIVTASIAASLGIWVMTISDVTVIRWIVVGICATTLCALLAGWRYSVAPTAQTRAVIGLATGFVGGLSGLMGPILVLFQLAGQQKVATTRATTIVFLTLTSLFLLPIMYAQGVLTLTAVILGVLFLIPYGAGALIGQALFAPERERFYRAVAYIIIGTATLAGLPIWDQM